MPIVPDARPSWTAYGLKIAESVALRGDCRRSQVGAVIMRPDHSIVATGYNGTGSGGPSCLAGECPRGLMSAAEVEPLTSSYDTGPGSCVNLHAEQNAIIRASWDEMVNSTLFITREPCPGCRRMVTGTPMQSVIWPGGRATIRRGRFLPAGPITMP